jgi:predicted ATPase
MNYFDRIHVQGFRRLVDLDLELRPLNVIIGANGSGKTSLLDVFSLLAASASGGLSAKLSELGGITATLSFGRARQMSFELSTTNPQSAPVTYGLTMGSRGVSYEILSEKLFHDDFSFIESRNGNVTYRESFGGTVIQPTWDYNALETALSQVPKTFPSLERVRSSLAAFVYYHALDVGPRASVRSPQLLRPSTLPGKDGEDLVSCLYYLREVFRDRFEAIEDTLRTAFPGFVRLDFPPVAAGTLAMTWKDSNFAQPFYMHQLSEGMLRFLWLATLLQSPGLTAVTLLDEPEVSLGPDPKKRRQGVHRRLA